MVVGHRARVGGPDEIQRAAVQLGIDRDRHHQGGRDEGATRRKWTPTREEAGAGRKARASRVWARRPACVFPIQALDTRPPRSNRRPARPGRHRPTAQGPTHEEDAARPKGPSSRSPPTGAIIAATGGGLPAAPGRTSSRLPPGPRRGPAGAARRAAPEATSTGPCRAQQSSWPMPLDIDRQQQDQRRAGQPAMGAVSPADNPTIPPAPCRPDPIVLEGFVGAILALDDRRVGQWPRGRATRSPGSYPRRAS